MRAMTFALAILSVLPASAADADRLTLPVLTIPLESLTNDTVVCGSCDGPPDVDVGTVPAEQDWAQGARANAFNRRSLSRDD